jgi:hypothetical protein
MKGLKRVFAKASLHCFSGLLQTISQQSSSNLLQTIEDGEDQTTSLNGSFLMYWTMCNAQKWDL